MNSKGCLMSSWCNPSFLTLVLGLLFLCCFDEVASKLESVKGQSGNLNPRRRLSSTYDDSDDDDATYNDQKLIVFFGDDCVSSKEDAQVECFAHRCY